jgi:hypothetical protein
MLDWSLSLSRRMTLSSSDRSKASRLKVPFPFIHKTIRCSLPGGQRLPVNWPSGQGEMAAKNRDRTGNGGSFIYQKSKKKL